MLAPHPCEIRFVHWNENSARWCTHADLPVIVHSGDHEWSTVPVTKLSVVMGLERRRLEGLYIPRPLPEEGNVVTLTFSLSAPEYTNAMEPGMSLPNNSRRWRKEFREHARQYYYRYPELWVDLSWTETDKVVAWILQQVATDLRKALGNTPHENGYVRQIMAHRQYHEPDCEGFHTALHGLLSRSEKRDAKSTGLNVPTKFGCVRAGNSIGDFKDLNGGWIQNLIQFLSAAENRYHCFVY